jgi:hypothetical protein
MACLPQPSHFCSSAKSQTRKWNWHFLEITWKVARLSWDFLELLEHIDRLTENIDRLNGKIGKLFYMMSGLT